MRKFKKCLITGVTGSGGSYLAEYILQKDKYIKIYGFYRSPGYLEFLKKKHKRIKFYKVDLNNFQITKNKLKKVKPDVIFHLASNADVRGSFDKPKEIVSNNNNITLNLLCFLLRRHPVFFTDIENRVEHPKTQPWFLVLFLAFGRQSHCL